MSNSLPDEKHIHRSTIYSRPPPLFFYGVVVDINNSLVIIDPVSGPFLVHYDPISVTKVPWVIVKMTQNPN